MEIKKRINGYILAEVIIALLIISFIAASLGVVFLKGKKNLTQFDHRLQAMNFARSVANELLEAAEENKYYYSKWPVVTPEEFTEGWHTRDLPTCYFKNNLSGVLKYNVEIVNVQSKDFSPTAARAMRVTIEVTWREPSKDKDNTETLVITPFINATGQL